MAGQADANGGEVALTVRRRMGGTERLMRFGEQSFGGSFCIAAVLTLCSPTPLTAAALKAAVHAVADRHDALRTVIVRKDTFAVAPPSVSPVVDVKTMAVQEGGG